MDRIFVDAFWNPNNYLLGGSLDALKNYFTPAWFVKYNSGVHFTGMNYPYGEHVLYTDNQPLLSWDIVGHSQPYLSHRRSYGWDPQWPDTRKYCP